MCRDIYIALDSRRTSNTVLISHSSRAEIGLQSPRHQPHRPEKNKPIQSLRERKIQLEAVKYVDDIFVYETESDLIDLLKLVKPDIRILGSDYKDESFTGDDLNIPVYYHERDHDYSSSDLRKKILQN